MSWLEAVWMGIIQGITEFLPVSSLDVYKRQEKDEDSNHSSRIWGWVSKKSFQ